MNNHRLRGFMRREAAGEARAGRRLARSLRGGLWLALALLGGCSPQASLDDPQAGLRGGPAAAQSAPAEHPAAEKALATVLEKYSGAQARIQVPVTRLQPAAISDELSITGELVPARSVIVKSLMDGRIRFARPIKVGDRVSSGTIIARIDDRDIEDDIDQQRKSIDIDQEKIKLDQTDLEQKRKDRTFDEQLLKEGFINQTEYDRSVMTVKQAEIELRQSQIGLEQEQSKLLKALRQREKVPIVAPIGGMVVLASQLTSEQNTGGLLNEEIMSIEDQLVATGTSICGIISDEGYLAECMVNGKDKARIHEGQTAKVSVISYRPFDVPGEVTRVALLQDVKTHAYKVWLKLGEMDKSFTSGLFVRSDLQLERHGEALVADRDYVKERGNRRFVQIVVDGKVRDIFVQTGLTQENRIELIDGVNPGDMMIASKEIFVADQSVTPVTVEAADEAPGRTIHPVDGVLPLALDPFRQGAPSEAEFVMMLDGVTTATQGALQLTLTGLDNPAEITITVNNRAQAEPAKMVNDEGKQTVTWKRVAGLQAGANRIHVKSVQIRSSPGAPAAQPGFRLEGASLILRP